MKSIWGTSLVLLIILVSVQCHKIMLVFHMPSSSHFILGSSLARGLAEKGHNITLVAPFADKTPAGQKYRQIVVSEIDRHHKALNMDMFQQPSMIEFFSKFSSLMNMTVISILNHPEIREMINNNETYDAIIIEEFQLDALKALPYLFKAHSIVFSSMGANAWVNDLVGNPTPLAYIPEVMTGFQHRMTFFQRVINVISHYMGVLIKYAFFIPKQESLVKETYPGLPSLNDMKYNVSLLLLNCHIATVSASPTVPNMVPIGGYHIQPPKPLPTDLQQFLDNSKEGVIYFSMGSVLNTTNFPKEKRDVILDAFKQLKQKVLWKWNEDIPEKSSNVKIEKWLPQQSVLAHPNVKLFITHGGLLSTTETIYHGKPVLAIPIFGDQPTNAQQMANAGFALVQKFTELDDSQKFLEKVKELLDNPEYYNNAQRRSKIFHDLPMKPIDTANFWIEYVIRHKGAHHLRVAGVELPWYKLYLVDVTLFLLGVLYVAVKVVKLVFRKLICRKKQEKQKKA